jgi:iron(II)-dependent oxidoreductase
MHAASLTFLTAQAGVARRGGPAALARALADSRADTLATFAACERALPGLRVPRRSGLNPPLWELGHIGWFQEHWLGRNPHRGRGHAADPDVPRHPPRRAGADALYDSSRVPHASRWELPLPDAAATRDDLAWQLDQSLGLLAGLADDRVADLVGDPVRGPGGGDACDDALYFFRLALLHEDMHHEAALYMAQGLGIPIDDPRWQAPPLPAPQSALTLAGGQHRLGGAPDGGFAFDNELPGQVVALHPFEIDAQAVRWAEYLPFVDNGACDDPRWWSPVGLAWRVGQPSAWPRYLRRTARGWEQQHHGAWQPLHMEGPACHLSLHEAEAWCRWAGRRLPTEAEWESAALTHGAAFRWGDVWEWTASPFAPHPGFVPHPYRDYSAPWFDGRPVLRGASFMTQPRLRDARYRNFFPPDRSDVPAGFRSCRTSA